MGIMDSSFSTQVVAGALRPPSAQLRSDLASLVFSPRARAAAELGALDLELSAAQAAQEEVSPRSAPCTVHPEPQNPKT